MGVKPSEQGEKIEGGREETQGLWEVEVAGRCVEEVRIPGSGHANRTQVGRRAAAQVGSHRSVGGGGASRRGSRCESGVKGIRIREGSCASREMRKRSREEGRVA